MSKLTDLDIETLLNRLDEEVADDIESYYLDIKPWADAKDALKTACEYAACFANADGGTLIFGIHDKVCGRAKAIHGVDRVNLDVFGKGIFQGTKPSIHANVRLLRVPEGTGELLVVEISAGDQKPYGTASGLYKQRIEKNCMPLDPASFLHGRVSSGAVDWSGAYAQNISPDELDPLQILRARNILRNVESSAGLLDLSDKEFLQGLEAMRDGRVTHTGLLLFGRQDVLARACPQAQFHYVLQTDETHVARNDIQRLGLLDIVERMDLVFNGPLNPEREVALGLFKMRIPDYPVEGIREGLLNALTHRDYLSPAEVLLRHTPSEVVITSPGGFVGGITVENILRHEPRARNRTLANALMKLRLVESAGVGRKRIFRTALLFGKRRPEYSTDNESVTLRIFNRGVNNEMLKLLKQLEQKRLVVSLEQLLVLDAMGLHPYIDPSKAAHVLQLASVDAREVLDQMAAPPYSLLERRGYTTKATYHLSKEIAKTLVGSAAYTRARGINPIRYAELAREYLKDHQSISNRELRALLGLGESNSANVEASKYLAKWSKSDGFLDAVGAAKHRVYRLRALI